MQQADDFLAESEALHELINQLDDSQLKQTTAFKDWTLNDVVGHLHVWNHAAELSLRDGEAFQRWFAGVAEHVTGGSLRQVETDWLEGLSGTELVTAWHAGCVRTAAAFALADPSARVQWAGPGMSARSSITARLMETWAHGQEIYDQLGVERNNSDRIRNIVVLGNNTYGWTFQVRGLPVPQPQPALNLLAPSGDMWRFGEADTGELISGNAAEFCQVVTQVRNIADTSLEVSGSNASAWMSSAQCFAGPPETPPSPGTRFTRTLMDQ